MRAMIAAENRSRSKTLHALVALALVFALTFAPASTGLEAWNTSVDPKSYLADVKTLSAPNMEGRGAGT
jgi:hypothetical protein